jgi:hypothetical protein
LSLNMASAADSMPRRRPPSGQQQYAVHNLCDGDARRQERSSFWERRCLRLRPGRTTMLRDHINAIHGIM